MGREPVKRTLASFNLNFDTDAAKAQRSFLNHGDHMIGAFFIDFSETALYSCSWMCDVLHARKISR